MKKRTSKKSGDTKARKIRKRKAFVISDAQAQEMISRAMQAGWLLWIKTSAWGNRRHLSDELLQEKFQDDAEAIRAVMRLVDTKEVQKVTKPMGQAQNRARSKALPWFHEGVYFILESDVEALDAALQVCKKDMLEARTELVQMFPALKAQAKKDFPNLYKEEYYPDQKRLEQAFDLIWGWQKIALPVADESQIGIISKDVVTRENTKFQEMMKANAEQTIIAIRASFLQIISRLRDKLVDPTAKFKDRTVEKPKEFLARFKEINIFNDQPFEKMAKDIEEILDGVEGRDLRDDEEYRKEMGEVMDEVVQEFGKLPTVKIERSLEF